MYTRQSRSTLNLFNFLTSTTIVTPVKITNIGTKNSNANQIKLKVSRQMLK